MLSRFFLLIVIVFSIYTDSHSQFLYGPVNSTYRRSLKETYAGAFSGVNLPNTTDNIKVGFDYQYEMYRAVYQWDLRNSQIPANSTVDSVTAEFSYQIINSGLELQADFYAIPDTINGSYVPDQGLWVDMNNPNSFVGGRIGAQNTIIKIPSSTAFKNTVTSALTAGKLVLGVKSNYESWVNGTRTYYLHSGDVKLRIYYTPPTKQVVINQKLSSGQNTGQLRKWEIQNNQFGLPFAAGTTLPLYIGMNNVLLSDQSIISNEKYNNWNTLSDVTNFHPFIVDANTSSLTSNFQPTNNTTIQAHLIDGGNPGGSLDFMDPWLIDYPDPNYGNNLRNQGMSAPFKSVAYSSNNLGTSTSYKGVFLNQPPDPNNPNVPYFSVRAPLTQTNVNGYTGYFQNWSVLPSNGATFQQIGSNPSGYDQKAVVFNQANAIVTANYKGHLISGSSIGFNTNSQRKVVRTDDGKLHMVYESMNQVWYTYSTDGGANWQK